MKGFAEKEKLQDFKIIHNTKIKASDGKYQIDVYAEFTAMGSRFKVLCECKKYKNRVNRDKVAILHHSKIATLFLASLQFNNYLLFLSIDSFSGVTIGPTLIASYASVVWTSAKLVASSSSLLA